MQVQLSKWQTKVYDDPHRFKVIICGRRAGKTTLSALKIIDFALTHPKSNVWYVSPSYVQSEQIMWRMIKDYLPKQAIKSTNDTKLRIELKNNSYIELKGADTEPDRLRGVKLDFLVLDEIDSFRNWKIVWEEVLRPTLMDSKGHAMFIGTPKGYRHLFELYNKQVGDTDYISYKFTSYDNPFLPKEEIDKAKQETDEDTFAQEYLAEFKKYSGLVYKDFSREKHVVTPFEIPVSWTRYRMIDFGFVHPTAVVFMAIDDKGGLVIYDLIYQAGLSTPELANLIAQRSVGQSFVSTIGDSAAASDISELSSYGIAVFGVKKESGDRDVDWATYRIRKITEKLKTGTIRVFSNLEPLIYEFENYQYKEVQEGGITKEVPMKMNDDALDALSYGVVNLPEYIEKTYQSEMRSPYNPSKWSI